MNNELTAAVGEKVELPLFDRIETKNSRLSTNDSEQFLFGAFSQIALCCKAMGMKVGSKAIFEMLRLFPKFEAESQIVRIGRLIQSLKVNLPKRIIRTKSGNKLKYKIDNTLTGEFARRFDEKFPQHKGYFEERIREKDIRGQQTVRSSEFIDCEL